MAFLRAKIYFTNRKSEKTEFANVYKSIGRINGRDASGFFYSVQRKGCTIHRGGFKDARTAALALDKALIVRGFEPLNILKRK